MKRRTSRLRLERHVVVALSSLLALLLAGCGDVDADAESEGEDPVVARIDGESVRFSEIERRAGWRLHRARLDVYLVLEREIDRWIEEQLLERAAREAGVDVEALLQEAVAGIEPVLDTDVDRYLEAHPSEVEIETARPRIRHYLEQTRRIERKLALLEALREQAEIEILLTPPPRPRSQLDLRDAPARGSEDAAIVIVHFADLRSEDSALSARDLARLEREFPGQIRVVHRNLPVERDELGLLTAQLAATAQRSGKFWALHDRLVASGGVEGRAELEAIARALELGGLLSELAGDGESLRKVRRDLEQARDAGIGRAPTLFVNGRYFMGLDGYEALRTLAEEELGADPRR